MTGKTSPAVCEMESRGGWYKHRFGVLLAALMLLMAGSPILQLLGKSTRFNLAGLLVTILFVLVLLAAVFAVSQTRRTVIIALALAIPSAAAQFIQSSGVATGTVVHVVDYTLGIGFLGFVVTRVLGFLFRSKRVNFNVICASLCVYLLLGVLWAILYSLLVVVGLGTFQFSFAEGNESEVIKFGGDSTFLAIYYSLVTMSTLGYGDIIPTSSLTRMCAALQAIVGQLYLAVLVARLVGLQIAQSSND